MVDCAEGACGTSEDTNRMSLFGTTFIVVIVGFFLMGSVSDALLNELLWTHFYLTSWRIGVAMALSSAALVVCCGVGFFAAWRRNKVAVKIYIVGVCTLVVVQSVAALFAYRKQTPNTLSVAADTEFLSGWKQTIAEVKESGDAKYSFINMIESDGQCCGFDSLADPLQNPTVDLGVPNAAGVFIPCGYEQVCKEYFQEWVREEILGIFNVYIALVVLTLVLVVAECLFLCSITPKPSAESSAGDYYSTSGKQMRP